MWRREDAEEATRRLLGARELVGMRETRPRERSTIDRAVRRGSSAAARETAICGAHNFRGGAQQVRRRNCEISDSDSKASSSTFYDNGARNAIRLVRARKAVACTTRRINDGSMRDREHVMIFVATRFATSSRRRREYRRPTRFRD